MDREMWILRQLETSLTASAEALAERLQVSPRTITNAINTLNRMLAPATSVRPTGGRYRLYILDPQEYSQIRSRLVRATDSLNDPRHRRAQEFGVLLSAKHPVTSDDLADKRSLNIEEGRASERAPERHPEKPEQRGSQTFLNEKSAELRSAKPSSKQSGSQLSQSKSPKSSTLHLFKSKDDREPKYV